MIVRVFRGPLVANDAVKPGPGPVVIAPNPAAGSLVVQGLPRATPFTLTDGLGRTVLKALARPGQPVNLAGLRAGLYQWHAADQHGRVVLE